MNSSNAVHDRRTPKASDQGYGVPGEHVFEKDLRRLKYSEKKRMEYRHISKRRD